MSTQAEVEPRFEIPTSPSRAPGGATWPVRRWVIAASLAAAVVGLILLAIGLAVAPRRVWLSYLDAWTFGTSMCLGALLLLMVGHAAKAGWMVVTRRLSEAVVDALPLFAILFVPLAFALHLVYPWAQDPGGLGPAMRHAVEEKRVYLNAPFFIVRTAIYFAVFVTIGTLLRAWSRELDERPRHALVVRMRRLSGGALPVVALALTWASFDWVMSLEPDWYSTIFGLYFFAGSFVGATGLACVMLQLSRMRASVRAHVTADHGQALGRVLFAMNVFWAYMAFSQLLIYWIASIPEEVAYYGRRTAGTWSVITYLLVFAHFVVPFFLLVSRQAKRHLELLASIGAFMVLMHFVDVYWLVMPSHQEGGVRPHWLDLGAILFMGGLSCAWIVHRYLGAPPIPRHVPDLASGLHYEASV